MTGDRLNSGMTGAEAVRRASQWWDKTGRGGTKREFTEVRSQRASKVKPGLPLVIVKDVEVDAFSGILQGKRFRDLSQAEQLEVVKHWHHHFVVVPTRGLATATVQ